jgi:hypothetical protein
MRATRRLPPFACDEDGGFTGPRFAAADRLDPPCEAASRRAQEEFDAPAVTKQRDGQISKNLSSPRLKNILLSPSGKSVV